MSEPKTQAHLDLTRRKGRGKAQWLSCPAGGISFNIKRVEGRADNVVHSGVIDSIKEIESFSNYFDPFDVTPKNKSLRHA